MLLADTINHSKRYIFIDLHVLSFLLYYFTIFNLKLQVFAHACVSVYMWEVVCMPGCTLGGVRTRQSVLSFYLMGTKA